MRHVLFVHDHRFKVSLDGSVFSEGKITDSVLERYQVIAEQVVVVARQELVADTKKLDGIAAGKAEFRFVRGVSFSKVLLRHGVANVAMMLVAVRESRCVIARLPSILGLLACVLAKLLRRPLFVEVVGDALEAIRGASRIGLLGHFAAVVFDRMCALAIRSADGAIYVTSRYLQTRYPNTGLTESASNVELICPDSNPFLERQRRLQTDSLTIGTIGSYFNNSKGFETAIAAVHALRAEHGRNVHLRILGSGDVDSYLETAVSLDIEDAVHFDGSLPGGDPVKHWLDCLDVYIQPSWGGEGLPRALLEAMARGLPAVGTNISGLPEVLAEGFAVEPRNVEALASRILRICDDVKLRASLSAHSYQTAKHFDSQVLRARRAGFWSRAASICDAVTR